MAKIILVTGTDTGIGKTIVTASILQELLKTKRSVGIIKPIETGCTEGKAGELFPEDGSLYAQITGEPVESIVPFRLRSAVGPVIACDAEKRTITKAEVLDPIRKAAGNKELLFVEGAGGLLVSIVRGFTFADLALELGASVVVVVASRLGAGNHAALTFEALRARRIPILGYILNELYGDGSSEEKLPGVATPLATNRALLREIAEQYEVPLLGIFPQLDASNRNSRALSSRAAESSAEEIAKKFA